MVERLTFERQGENLSVSWHHRDAAGQFIHNGPRRIGALAAVSHLVNFLRLHHDTARIARGNAIAALERAFEFIVAECQADRENFPRLAELHDDVLTILKALVRARPDMAPRAVLTVAYRAAVAMNEVPRECIDPSTRPAQEHDHVA